MLLKPKNIEHLTRQRNSALQKNKQKILISPNQSGTSFGAAKPISQFTTWMEMVENNYIDLGYFFLCVFFFAKLQNAEDESRNHRGSKQTGRHIDIYTQPVPLQKNATFFFLIPPKTVPGQRQAALLLDIALELEHKYARDPSAIRLSLKNKMEGGLGKELTTTLVGLTKEVRCGDDRSPKNRLKK